jgi:transposase
MQTTIEAIRAFDHELEQLCRTHEDDHLCASLPSAGTVDAARLTAAMGTVRDRGTTVDERLCCSAVAPVMERRGKSTWRRWRDFGPTCLRQSFHEYAGESINSSFWARVYDMSQRARGTSHQAAVRALACKWIRIIDTCWQTRMPYSEVRDLERLRKKGSPLLTFAANNPS